MPVAVAVAVAVQARAKVCVYHSVPYAYAVRDSPRILEAAFVALHAPNVLCDAMPKRPRRDGRMRHTLQHAENFDDDALILPYV